MAQRCKTSTCCLTLPLKLEKWQEDRLAKRFEIARQIYNTLVRAELKKLRRLEQSREYWEIQTQLRDLYQKNAKGSKAFQGAGKSRLALLKKAGFTEFDFKRDVQKYYKHFSANIGSNVAIHCIAAQVWIAFEKKLHGNGKTVHFKRPGEIRSLRGYSKAGKSGGSEIMFRKTYIEWKGLRLPLKLDPDNSYENEMLNYRVKYVRIIREPGKTRDHWYAQLVLEGTPVRKYNPSSQLPVHPVGQGAVGIDIGPQTVAYSSQSKADLVELADQVQNIEQKNACFRESLTAADGQQIPRIMQRTAPLKEA